jgi:RNA polymerase sigma-70 factor, ECF subfamily
VDRAEEDEQLIGRLATGDTTALDPLYDRYAGLVFALVLRILGDRQAAEDLLQEVFVRAWQRAGTYQQARGRVTTWLLGIAHNLAIDEVRRRGRRPQGVTEREADDADEPLLSVPSTDPDVADQAWERLRRTRISAALAQLPSAQRAIIELAYFEGYTQSEIAAQLGEPLGTVKTRTRLGLRKLRDMLQGQELELEAD